MIRAIIFDFDGVLVESVNIKTEAFAELFVNEGKENVERIVDYHLANGGMSRFEKFRNIYQSILSRELDEGTMKGLSERFSDLVVEKVVGAPFVSGASEFLDKHSGEYLCFVVSATPQDELREIVVRRNMSVHFREVFGSPATKEVSIDAIVSKYGLRRRDIVFVGDALKDYEAAENSQIHFIARVAENTVIFDHIDCVKVRDLIRLPEILQRDSFRLS